MITTLLSLLPATSRPRLIRHLLLTALSVILRAVGVVLLIPIVTALFSPTPSTVWPWVALLVVITAAGWVLDGIVARIGYEIGFTLLDTGQHAVADRIEQIRLKWFTGENTATARQAIAATGPDLVGLVVHMFTPLAGALLLPIAIAIALLPVSWPLGLAALAGVPLLFGAYAASTRIGRAADRATMRANSALTERIIEFARTQHALRAARRVVPERSHVGAALQTQHGATMRLLLMQVPGQLIFSIASQLALIILAGMAVVLTVGGPFAVPQAIALLVVVVRYLEPFTTVAQLSGGVESTVGTLRRIHTVLTAPTRTASGQGAGSALTDTSRAPRIALRDVTFGYEGDERPVIEDLRLTLEPGTTTAIVGPSGSGKSTVLSLLAGLYQPTAGVITVDGVDVSTIDSATRRDLVSMVFQEPYLFDATIGENILAGDPDASAQELDRAVGLARVEEIVRQSPEGRDARVGEAGATLSGGERQRVSIARALLKPAPLLLVDEATSALDTENEAAIVAALTADPTPRTRVIVAHRLASIRAADRVLFLQDGRILEDGTVTDLLAAGGRFAEFWQGQDAAAGWRLAASSIAGNQ